MGISKPVKSLIVITILEDWCFAVVQFAHLRTTQNDKGEARVFCISEMYINPEHRAHGTVMA